ncbi:MAG: 2OG-Fe(II) oxygenase [Deltaproteobacteria bacterium]|nr:MAG: 2OG-Fe(II) oxygenase [Deltaproteobacteria bacterium]
MPWLVLRFLRGGLMPLQALAGKPLVITYLVSAGRPQTLSLVERFEAYREHFDGQRALHLIVTCDPSDEENERFQPSPPGRLLVADVEGRLARALGLVGSDRSAIATVRATSFVLGPDLRVVAALPIRSEDHVEEVLAAMPPEPEPEGLTLGGIAPVLMLPVVLEPELCRALIEHYDRSDAQPTGVVVNRPDGTGELVVDPKRKTRRDIQLRHKPLLQAVHQRIQRRIAPELRKAFQFKLAHVERFALVCYLASEGGWFGAHRDNQGKATAHRQFALTLNLNAEDYEGGDLWFPEYGTRRYRAPTGGALVFSCSLLHAVDPVTSGRRLAVVPFLYDAQGMKIRKRNYAELRG